MMFHNDFKSIESFDERVSRVELRWGRHQRPLWRSLEKLTPDAQIKWIDRVSAFEAVSCEWALALVYEKALNIQVSNRANHIRALLSELQRLLWGFDFLSKTFRALQDSIRIEQALRLREYVFQGQEVFTGSRVLPQALKIGGVERDFSVGDIRKFKEILKNIEFEIRMFFKDLTSESLFTDRLKNVLPISKEVVKKFNWYGPVGQASGLAQDLRLSDRYGTYGDLVIKCFEAGANGNSEFDALARVQCVLFQIRQSINICYHLLVSIPDGEIASTRSEVLDIPKKTFMAQVEGASGPIVATLQDKKITVTTVSTRVHKDIEELLVGSETEDLELSLATLGFSFEEADLV